MATEGDKESTPAVPENDNDSDVELEGMDLEGDDGDAEDSGDVDMEEEPTAAEEAETEDNDKLAHEDQDELEAAHREQKELMLAEQKKAAEQHSNQSSASMAEKLQYLISQSDVFAHFLAGSVAATDKKNARKKGGSRGKKNRMTEAEEDAQLLKTAESKRSVIRLNKQVRVVWVAVRWTLPKPCY